MEGMNMHTVLSMPQMGIPCPFPDVNIPMKFSYFAH